MLHLRALSWNSFLWALAWKQRKKQPESRDWRLVPCTQLWPKPLCTVLRLLGPTKGGIHQWGWVTLIFNEPVSCPLLCPNTYTDINNSTILLHDSDKINLCSYSKERKKNNHSCNNFSVNKVYGKGLYTNVFFSNMGKATGLSIYYDFGFLSLTCSK